MDSDAANAVERVLPAPAAVQTPVIPIVSRWIAETPGTISLGQGIVVVRAAAGGDRRAAARSRRRSTTIATGPSKASPRSSALLEDKLARENGIRVRPTSRVVVTAGGNLAFMNAVLAIADPGDEIILPVPFYFNHEMAVVDRRLPRGARADARDDYQLDLDAIARAITPRTRAVVTVSPNNPTGAVYPEPALRAVNALCRERGVFHIHDEAYEYFTYDGARALLAGLDRRRARRTRSRSTRCRRRTASRAGASATW